MGGISEVSALDVKKKSKKRKGRESAGGRDGDLKDEAELLSFTSASDTTVAEAVSSVDMNNDSSKNPEDSSRKEEKTEKNTTGLDLKKKKKNQIGVEEAAPDVEKQQAQAQQEGHSKKKKKNKTIEPELEEKGDVVGLQGQEGKAREKDKVKKKKNKNKELSKMEPDYDGVGREDCIENQVNSGVDEHIEPVSDRKKKRKEGLREDLLHDRDSSKGVTSKNGAAANGSGRGDGLIRGKRFSKEEDALVEKAVLDYIEAHQLGQRGVHMVMKSQEYPELEHCWKQICKVVPWRPYETVCYRAHVLFERGQARNWTQEELELVRKFHQQHSAKWRTLADQLGRHRRHVRNAWRCIKPANLKKGSWSQGEYQSLFDLVNVDLSLKAFQDKKSKQGMLRDNISWEAISDKLATRPQWSCCRKWYHQLSSPLAAEGKWSDSDDYRLLIALVELDAACEEDVDWDNLLEHRPGDICRKRWHQMVLHIGENAIKPFNEQVEILSNRYCPHLLQPREAYANKPFVDL